MKRQQCMNCGSGALHEFLDLGRQPNGNNFPSEAEKATEQTFPLLMLVCSDCWQVQIDELPPQRLMFHDHPYITGVNIPIVRHFQALVPHLITKLGLEPNDLAIDIGCNDGTLLRIFAEHGLRVLGVDPSKRTTELAQRSGVTVCRTFWNSQTGEILRRLDVQPQVITATAVFYHVPDLHDFLDGVVEIMGPRTVFVVQCVNLKDLIERNEFDHFYHEHSCIHSILTLQTLLRQHGLRTLDLEFCEVHGGSFILYVVRDEYPAPTTETVSRAIAAEMAAGLDSLSTYRKFAERVQANVHDLKSLLSDLRRQDKRIFALGAPVKGSTLLNYAGIGPELVACATEVNQFKIGRLMPGTHIPIVDEIALLDAPDYYLVLSWNLLEFLQEKYEGFLRRGGRFIVPVPNVSVIGPKNEVGRMHPLSKAIGN